MQSVAVILAFVAVASAQYAYAPASYIARAPAHDSAVIKSDRLGGNFAYSVAESHAYAQHTPIVQHVTSPVAVSYSAPAVQYATQYAAAPAAVSYAAAPAAVTYAAAPSAVRYAAAPAAVQYTAGVYGASPIAYNNNAAFGYGYAAAPGLAYSTILKK